MAAGGGDALLFVAAQVRLSRAQARHEVKMGRADTGRTPGRAEPQREAR